MILRRPVLHRHFGCIGLEHCLIRCGLAINRRIPHSDECRAVRAISKAIIVMETSQSYALLCGDECPLK